MKKIVFLLTMIIAATGAVPILCGADTMNTNTTSQARATFGGGCFWCMEAIYKSLDGVESVVSGYSGGHTKNPTYKEVCSGETGHAEVVQITFDPAKISYQKLLEIFWAAHDPTSLNKQGNDVGTQYRSVIFYADDAQREAAVKSKAALATSGTFKTPIVTEIKPLINFYPAEDYHRDYYKNNPNQPYCYFVIRPKLEKLEQKLKAR